MYLQAAKGLSINNVFSWLPPHVNTFSVVAVSRLLKSEAIVSNVRFNSSGVTKNQLQLDYIQ